jgi:hypothetical protein
VLDEMHAPAVAQALRKLGHDVVAVAEEPDLRAMTDLELFRWAAERGRRVVTENVKDFRPLLRYADEAGQAAAALLLTSSRSFPRSRRNPAPLVDALDHWLRLADVATRPDEDWLRPPLPSD